MPPARLGEHNDYAYAELLGHEPENIERLRETCVLGEVPLNRLV